MKVNGKAFARKWMGKKVKVTAYYSKHARLSCPPVIGWVVGYTFRRRGEFDPGGPGSYNSWTGEYDGGEASQFVCNGPSTPVVLVRPWPHLKPLDVPFDAIELTDEEPTWSGGCGFPGEDYEYMRKLMAAWPRDEKGRWVKLDDETYKDLVDRKLL